MSISNLVDLPDLVIPIGTDFSNVLNGRLLYEDAFMVSLISPATLDVGFTYGILVSADMNALVYNPATFFPLELSLGVDATVPSAGRGATYLELPGWAAFCILASGNVGGTRTWKAVKSWGAR